uniref:CUE domain-containing protein n=1 Tax=Haemonchus contortus TaxID=6289 RepID=A0A7I4Z602_HAECO
MPSKQQRSKKASLSSSQPPSSSTSKGDSQIANLGAENFQNMSAMELLKSIIELNHDPAIENMLIALSEKIPMEFSDLLESDKRGRSIVISGLDEGQGGLRPSARQRDLKDKVFMVLDALDVECRPVEMYRMGKPNPKRPRLVKVVLPSRSHWRRVLANARLLREAGLPNVFIRRSMTEDERKREYELRQEARERNKGSSTREWVVYQGQLKRASELPHRRSGNH